jgi:hypothetical protein
MRRRFFAVLHSAGTVATGCGEDEMRRLLIAALLLSTSGAHAGWFGPSNYRECLLDEMKGRVASMLSTVKGLCNERFPCPEPTPSEYYKCNNLPEREVRPASPVPPGWDPPSEVTSELLRLSFPKGDCLFSIRKSACPGGNLD